MSVSPDHPSPPNLYCTEVAADLLSSDADSFTTHDETSIVTVFDTELNQMLGSELLSPFLSIREVVTARQEAIKWMLKVHAYYRFRPETAYISVNYLDRFLSSHTLPQGKGWPMQLLAVACLAIAAKMEEIKVPLLLDLQIIEPRFLFKPRTVQRMELLVMTSLKWRLRTITPFDFLHYFIAKLPSFGSRFHHYDDVYSHASHIILSTCHVVDFLGYPPSTMAAAAVLWAANQTTDDQKLGCFHKKVNKEMVKRCHSLIKRNMSQFLHIIKHQNSEPAPPSPNGVLDAVICDISFDTPKFDNKDFKSGHASLPNKC